MILCWTDAAYRGGNAIGCGYVLRRHSNDGDHELVDGGHRIVCGSEFDDEFNHVSHDSGVLRAEYRALISGVRAATDFDDEAIWIRTDNRTVVRRVSGREPISGSGYYHHALFSFLERFRGWRITYTPRERNQLAHDESQRAMAIA